MAALAVLTGATVTACSASPSEAEALCSRLDAGVVPIAVSELDGAQRDQAGVMDAMRRALEAVNTTCPQHSNVAASLEFVLNPPAFIQPPAAAPAAPVSTVPAAPVEATTRTTSESETAASDDEDTGAMSAAECEHVAATSSMSNAELRPYLRARGCDDAADGLLVGAAGSASSSSDADSSGDYASSAAVGGGLAACMDQTGRSAQECRDASARGEGG